MVSMEDGDLEAKARKLLSEYPLIDGHNDLPMQLRDHFHNQIYDKDKFDFRNGLFTETDLLKLQQGKLGGQFWSVYVQCKPENTNWNEDDGAVRDTLEQIDVIKRLIDENDELEYCTTPVSALEAFKASKLASMIGAEGLHQAGSSIANIRMLFELGVRYITVTHNINNAFATCALSVTNGGIDHGLTTLGKAGIMEMNRLGMLVDLSHVSVKTMEDTLQVTRSPVIFSHSAARGLSDHGRNVPDHILDQMPANGGVVMIPFVTQFLNVRDPQSVDADTVVDHIYYVAKRAGWDHVGIGSDYDGCRGNLPIGMKDTSCYPTLVQAVLARGATDEQVKQMMGGNILRVWHENVDISQNLIRAGEKPREEYAPGRDFSLHDGP